MSKPSDLPSRSCPATSRPCERRLAGRTFTDADNVPGRNLVVIDEFLAARAFPNDFAVGQLIRLPDPRTPWTEVIGVVAHQRLFSLAESPRPTVYFSDGFWGIGISRSWIIRTAGDRRGTLSRCGTRSSKSTSGGVNGGRRRRDRAIPKKRIVTAANV